MTEFTSFPKISRLNRPVICTEKLDGTNAQIKITEDCEFLVGSRNRWITPKDDNYGFALWAYDHKDELMGLGVGSHFGEWWGHGIQRGYGLYKGDRRFSLFNVTRWCLSHQKPEVISSPDAREVKYQERLPACCGLVPVVANCTGLRYLHRAIERLQDEGSFAAPGFMSPEGIVAFHTSSNQLFKVTLEGDDAPKSKQK